MPCRLTVNGVTGSRSEALVASTWLLPVEPAGQGGYGYGRNTTSYGPPPSTPGLGYAFSGGAGDVTRATIVTCDGHAADFVLGAGGSADIQLLDGAGAPVSSSGSTIPPGQPVSLPGLGDHAALETAPISADGHQLLSQLAAGTLHIHGTASTLTCSGSGVVANPSIAGADVTITPGHTATVICRAGS